MAMVKISYFIYTGCLRPAPPAGLVGQVSPAELGRTYTLQKDLNGDDVTMPFLTHKR
ncbi:MAG: hypothetical protein ACTHMM_13615 [Agriterribacter sp.]